MARNGNHDSSTRKMVQSGEDGQESQAYSAQDEHFLAADPQRRNPFYYIYNMIKEGNLAQTSAPKRVFAKMNNTTTWQERLAMFLMQTMSFLRSPLAKVGQVLEITANIIVANGGFLMTLWRLLYSFLFLFQKGEESSGIYSGALDVQLPK